MEYSFLWFFSILSFISYLEINDNDILRRRIYYYLTCAVIMSTMGLGYQLGVDWAEYERVYVGESLNPGNYEVAYVFINNYLNKMGINFWFYVIFLKIVFLTSLFMVVSKYCKLPVLALTFTLMFIFPFVNDPLRQLIAAIFLFSGFYFNQRKPGLLNIFVGSLFHSSYAIFISGYLNFFTKKSVYLILALISAVLFVIAHAGGYVADNMIYRKLSFYLEYSSISNVYASIFRVILFCYICFSASVYKINSFILGHKLTRSFWLLSLIYLWLEIIALTFPLLSQRMRLYLTPFSFILLSNYLNFTLGKLKANLIATVFYVYLFLSLFQFLHGPMGHFYSMENNVFLNYVTDFSNDKTYEVNEFWSKGI